MLALLIKRDSGSGKEGELIRMVLKERRFNEKEATTSDSSGGYKNVLC
jgi:hypothetical protein